MRPLGGRVALLLAGSTVATVCYALTIRAGLGLGPLLVLQQGFADHAGIAIGTSVTVIGFVFVVVAVSVRSWPGPGTLLLPVIGGVTLDGVLPYVPTFHGWFLRTAVVVGATVMMALGGSMMIRASVGVVAYDAVMLGLARMWRLPLAPVRLGMEASVLAVGWLLGGAVGVGTVITGLLIGPCLHLWLRVLGQPSRRSVGERDVAGPSAPLRSARRVPV